MMPVEPLAPLEYENSPNFLTGDNLADAPEFAHIFRYAHRPASDRGCSLRGVYALRDESKPASLVPLVYVCTVQTDAEAGKVHQRVWNQNIVPFLLVQTPREIRLYSGFRYGRPGDPEATDPAARGILRAAITFNQVGIVLNDFRAEAIDNGSLWRHWGKEVTPQTRVDWHLLEDLEELGRWLRQNGLGRKTAHALIGKYVYLRYLRDRDILSDAKFTEWKISPETVFGRQATLKGLKTLVDRLEGWLNGSVFPLDFSADEAPGLDHLRMVASTFKGDCPRTGQRVLDFQLYDFSHIPIETLSVIYQQFLHAEGKGKSEGAYYTPVPLVNFVLEELDDRYPLQEGMRVCDPACGSGAFLVHCYRRLVERQIKQNGGEKLKPADLHDLLVKHIFGMDRNEDACRVAELSLTLTLLDYIEPPDLSTYPQFQLPALHNRNIFQADFFAPESAWIESKTCEGFHWVVGNPPWRDLTPKDAHGENEHVWRWIQKNKAKYPTGGNQIAEAFAWKIALDLLNLPKGVVGLVLPAMTLFKRESTGFRKGFFGKMDICCVANFANLAEVLFRRKRQGSKTGRLSTKGARLPAAVFIYQGNRPSGSSILTFAPLIANQEANRPQAGQKRQETWNIVVNGSEIRDIPMVEAQEGASMPWKIAMWGSARDRRLLQLLSKRFPALRTFESRTFVISQGLELRDKDGEEPVEHVPDLIGKRPVDFSRLRRVGRLFHLPPDALGLPIRRDDAYVRKGRATLPLQICKPPHIIVHASRNFAIYSDEFLIVPPRQIGIGGQHSDEGFLKALSLYLSSAFVTYHQFFVSSEWGVQKNRTTLDDLRTIPTPVFALKTSELAEWSQLHQRLMWASENVRAEGHDFKSRSRRHNQALSLFEKEKQSESLPKLMNELNNRVYDLLRLDDSERALIDDLVHIRMHLLQGKLGNLAVSHPRRDDLANYASILKSQLDEFLQHQRLLHHQIVVLHDDGSGMVQIELTKNSAPTESVLILRADAQTAKEFEKTRRRLRAKHSQWLYFDRNLRIPLEKENRTYLFKPLQRLHWTRSQALVDADEIIADILTAKGD